jgi:hypothetical protein
MLLLLLLLMLVYADIMLKINSQINRNEEMGTQQQQQQRADEKDCA